MVSQGNPVSDGFGDTIMMSKEILMVADAVSAITSSLDGISLQQSQQLERSLEYYRFR